MITESPYITHREILLNGRYGTAYLLQEFLLYQLNPWQYPFDIDQHRGGFDSRHLQIYKDMKWWYCYNGSESEGFKDLAETIEARKLREAQALREACLLYTSPSPRDLSTSRMPSSA